MKVTNAIVNRFQRIADYLDSWEMRLESWQGKSSFVGVVVGTVLAFFLAVLPLILLIKGLFYAN